MINRNAKAFGHKDLTVTATALDGANARKTFTFDSAESVKLDGSPKASSMKGLSVAPISVTAVAAEPSVEWKLSVAEESKDFLKFLGDVGVRFTLDAVFATRGKTSSHYRATPCILDGGIGFDSSADSPPVDTIKAKPVDILIDGVSIYPKKGA
jgi:hypothetical protein